MGFDWQKLNYFLILTEVKRVGINVYLVGIFSPFGVYSSTVHTRFLNMSPFAPSNSPSLRLNTWQPEHLFFAISKTWLFEKKCKCWRLVLPGFLDDVAQPHSSAVLYKATWGQHTHSPDGTPWMSRAFWLNNCPWFISIWLLSSGYTACFTIDSMDNVDYFMQCVKKYGVLQFLLWVVSMLV